MIKRLSISLPESINDRLSYDSRSIGISKSQFVTLIIAQHYNIIDFCKYDHEEDEWYKSRNIDIELNSIEWSEHNG